MFGTKKILDRLADLEAHMEALMQKHTDLLIQKNAELLQKNTATGRHQASLEDQALQKEQEEAKEQIWDDYRARIEDKDR